MSKVFEEVKLKHLTLKNRLVRSATQDPFGSPDGFVTDRQKEPSADCPVGRVIHSVLDCSYGKIQRDLSSSLESITLGDIISDYKRCHREDRAKTQLQQA